eukprot:5180435-Prymnesium_polylepis.1
MLMGITLILSVHTLAFGMHCTRRGDSSIGLQCCEQLGAGFSCEAGTLDASDTRAERAWHSATAAGGAVLRAASRLLLLLGWCTPCESHLCWACVALGNSSIGRQC